MEDVEVKSVDGFSEVSDDWSWLSVKKVRGSFSQENREDSGRSFVSAQSDLISWSGNGCHIEFFIPEDGHQLYKHEKLINLGILGCVRVTHFEKVLNASIAFNVCEIVVRVFAATIDMVERLLVEESSESVPLISFLHDLHN